MKEIGGVHINGHPTSSHVLLAMGRPKPLASASIRFGLGRATTAVDIEQVVKHTTQTI